MDNRRKWSAALLVGVLAATGSCSGDEEPRADVLPVPTPTVSESSRPPALVTERIALRRSQPVGVTFERGELWVHIAGFGLFRLEDGEIAERVRTGLSPPGFVHALGRLWLTGGGDGGMPDGRIFGIDRDGTEPRIRNEYPNRSPYGIDAGRQGIFVALFQGDLILLDPRGNGLSSVPLSHGLTEVLVAHGATWVSSPQRGRVWRVVINSLDDTSAGATELHDWAPRRTSCPQGLASTKTDIWVADPCAGKVWLLDPAFGEVTGEIDGLGRKPVDLDITNGLAWVVSFRDEVVSVVDIRTHDVLAQSRAGHGASRIAARGREAWVSNMEDYSLTHFVYEPTG